MTLTIRGVKDPMNTAAPSPGAAKGPELTKEERRELIKLLGGPVIGIQTASPDEN